MREGQSKPENNRVGALCLDPEEKNDVTSVLRQLSLSLTWLQHEITGELTTTSQPFMPQVYIILSHLSCLFAIFPFLFSYLTSLSPFPSSPLPPSPFPPSIQLWFLGP